MAITIKGRTIELAAANDTISWTTMQGANPGATAGMYRARIAAIYLVVGATNTAIVLKNGGTGGIVFYNGLNSAVNTTQFISFAAPVEFDDFFVTTIPAGATVVVHLAD